MLRRTNVNASGVLLTSSLLASILNCSTFSRLAPLGLNFFKVRLTDLGSLRGTAAAFVDGLAAAGPPTGPATVGEDEETGTLAAGTPYGAAKSSVLLRSCSNPNAF